MTTTVKADLPAHVFDVTANVPLMHQVVVAQLAAARQGTHDTKTRGEVRGGGKKPYRQKGTGRARQGSTRAPQFAGGGTVHGPTPRDYTQKTPKKMKAAALRGALSDRARAGRVIVVDSLTTGDAPSTKAARKVIEGLVSDAGHRVLAVVGREDVVSQLSLRNLQAVHLIAPDQLNTYDVLVNDVVLFTEESLETFLAGPVAAPTRKSAAAAEPQALVKKAPAAKADAADDTDDAPYGPQSHAPLADGSAPEGFPVKGNADSMLYHVPGSSFYARTVAEVWFATAEAAEAAGFQLPPSQREKEEGK
ncbi:50S ribosomal protein L4 [Pseudonocardia sp. KRD-184]|uniref:Large ribosomal subunit protein uL4 n=1 Tax=Pseudonocardia oceani TaxID=2792013 RepID=A0ABS6U6Y9_9PSEU|nr:50S ribosomal protein L4 [Pseudonocardia oceani]MBW0094552.1 50S ribosomal protein L4 [Pseudonocardia oceani]MBW0107387.1 50S ribosomal protein L4 [Pseudonocardia oceani]MBW0120513.1 50S ribosomal protein L4 [Pseudonocardia oceani]MBW0127990.1 50S ribosomal protein L4 [Pseudonocardia oceani]